jgi:toxin-antitoxin system PIN domain toxin
MSLVDVNLLLYAHDRESEFHSAAREWLEAKFSALAPVYLSWVAIQGFLRISTRPPVARAAVTVEEATRAVDAWLARPRVQILEPGRFHWRIFRALLRDYNLRGAHVTDAHIAALAIEHGVVLSTHDRDFRRFEGLRLDFPLLKSSAG